MKWASRLVERIRTSLRHCRSLLMNPLQRIKSTGGDLSPNPRKDKLSGCGLLPCNRTAKESGASVSQATFSDHIQNGLSL
jgi:hypothetical protein